MPTAGFGNLAGRRAVVTGSSTGIGRAIAAELARAGADVVVHCRTSVKEAEALAGELRDLGRRANVLAADLANPKERAQFADEAWSCFNGVDIWVNNAGADLLTGVNAKIEDQEKLAQLLDVDVTATALLCRTIGRRMVESRSGTILNIGWDQAAMGMEGDSGELFATSKGAVMALTRSLALSLAPHVRVNCIAPGWIRTAWGERAGDVWQRRVVRETPLGRWGTPEDVAGVARFLVSAEAAFVTGQIINVNGGAVR